MFSKDEYLLRSISKINHKKWELFVITRVLHLLNDPDLEFVCQQYINASKGRHHYLTDLCFPSLQIYYEIDEGQHASKIHLDEDKLRQREILEATDWSEYRIRVYDKDDPSKGRDINEVIQEVDKFVATVRNLKAAQEKKLGKPLTWNFESKFDPQKYIDEGSIEVKNNVVLRSHRDVLKLFGYKKGHYQRAVWTHKKMNQMVWFPKLYKNNDWDNFLSPDGNEIKSSHVVRGKLVKHRSGTVRDIETIVFAHYKNILGQVVYKFMGLYKPIINHDEYIHSYKRIETKLDLKDYQSS